MLDGGSPRSSALVLARYAPDSKPLNVSQPKPCSRSGVGACQRTGPSVATAPVPRVAAPDPAALAQRVGKRRDFRLGLHASAAAERLRQRQPCRLALHVDDAARAGIATSRHRLERGRTLHRDVTHVTCVTHVTSARARTYASRHPNPYGRPRPPHTC